VSIALGKGSTAGKGSWETTMHIQLNGQPTPVAAGTTIGDLIRQKNLDPATIVVEHNLKRINPDLELQAEAIRLDADNVGRAFEGFHIIVEALDRTRDKKMMADTFMADPRLLGSASGIGGWGVSDRIRTRRVCEASYLVGDGHSKVAEDMHPTSAIVGIAAAKQADVVIEAILGNHHMNPM
jgi:sulfur carrier protein ThiS